MLAVFYVVGLVAYRGAWVDFAVRSFGYDRTAVSLRSRMSWCVVCGAL